MISIAQQRVAELGGPRSVLSRQRRDHVQLHRLLEELQTSSADRSGPLLVRIYRLVFPHAFAEEVVLWPALRRLLPDGDQLTLRVEKEHQAINELVKQLEAVPRGVAQWRKGLEQVIALLLQDVRDEEDVLLPRLQAVLSAQQLRRLGWQWALVRSIAPTRCHPVVSRRPPGNVLSALPLSLLDRVRDRVDMQRYRGGGRHATAQALSAGLARAAFAVEHLPLMQRGEHGSTHIQSASARKWKFAGIAAAVVTGALLLRRKYGTRAGA